MVTKIDKTELIKSIKQQMPEGVKYIVSALQPYSDSEIFNNHKNNIGAVQLVGGCIRDIAIGRQPHDWDITTSMNIYDVITALTACEHIEIKETGLKHGTVTAIYNDGTSYEITEYRTGNDNVDETERTLENDLLHRDFTINAIAYDFATNLIIDPFNGLHDISRKTIRAVDDAEKRFEEDGLRVLRAVRLAVILGFSIEYGTSQTIHACKHLIADTAVERQAHELMQILTADTCYLRLILFEYPDAIAEVIPEIEPCIGFPQYTKWHCYDVYRHMVEVCCGVSPDKTLRLAALLHDIGKPCSEVYKDGRQHFYGHQEPSARIAEEVCERLKIDRKTADTVTTLVRHHDDMTYPVTEKRVRRMAARIGSREAFDGWYEIRRADILAHSEEAWHSETKGLECCEKIKSLYDEMDGKGLTFNVKELHINGNDLMEIGFKEGPDIGIELKHLLTAVIDGNIANERNELIRAAKDDFKQNV